MKQETRIQKVLEDTDLDPLMRAVWLERYGEKTGLSDWTIEQCKEHLQDFSNDKLRKLIEGLESTTPELGSKPDTIAYDENVMRQILAIKEVQDFLISYIKGQVDKSFLELWKQK